MSNRKGKSSIASGRDRKYFLASSPFIVLLDRLANHLGDQESYVHPYNLIDLSLIRDRALVQAVKLAVTHLRTLLY